MKKNIKKIGFTLAELLLSLSIIGVISALSIPVVFNSSKGHANAAALKRAIATLDEAMDMVRLEAAYQPYPKCFYWASGKRPSWMCSNRRNHSP